MKNILYLSIILQLTLMISCENKIDVIADSSDYETYLNAELYTQEKIHTNASLEFWQKKLEANPKQSLYLIKLSSLFKRQFEISGELQHLMAEERNLKMSNKSFIGEKASVWRSLAHHYIGRHEFEKARICLDSAYALGEDQRATECMLFDVYLELGNYRAALAFLKRIENPNDFDYLIRSAKYYDHEGQLDEAILQLESALQIAKESRDNERILWSLSNLADFYGHAGRIAESYDLYIQCLALDPVYHYALKKIAWIAYSHDRDVDQARQILHFLKSVNKSPEYDYLLALTYHFTGDDMELEQLASSYFDEVNDPVLHKMFACYSFELHDLLGKNEILYDIAMSEVEERPTATSFAMLAYAAELKGERKMALELIRTNVLNKTEEPKPLMWCAKILENSSSEEYLNLKKEVHSASFELGPHHSKI